METSKIEIEFIYKEIDSNGVEYSDSDIITGSSIEEIKEIIKHNFECTSAKEIVCFTNDGSFTCSFKQ